METNDEIVELKYVHRRMYPYKETDLDFYNEICINKKSVYIRVIKIELSSGEIEYIATNLRKEEVSTEQMKELYNLRW